MRKRALTVEQLYPNPRARRAADAVVDALDPQLPMTAFLDAFDAEYFRVAGSSPFRRAGTKPP